MDNFVAKMDRIFSPKVVAVVGAKQANDYSWLRAHSPLQGKVYNVNMDRSEWPGAEALGFESVASLHDIPEPVDYVTLSVPRTVVPTLLRDCVAKGVGGAHIFAVGFAEIHTEEGIRLEETVADIAREGELLVIGPNCMGLYNPKMGLRQSRDQFHGEGGFFSYISQSGTTSMALSQVARAFGLPVSKGVSFGNGTVLDCTDFLEYLGQDEETEIIGMYLEGVRDGRRFFEALRMAAQRKPVLLWKVGLSEESSRAGAAHTGSAPISAALWDAILRQCGAIRIDSMQEMMDTAVALRHLGSIGTRVALIAMSGGHAGQIAEAFGGHGFHIPSPTEASLEEIASYSPLMGGSFTNPFEGPSVWTEDVLGKTLGVLGRDPTFDLVVLEVSVGNIQRDPTFMEKRLHTLKTSRQQGGKPVLAVMTADMPYAPEVDMGSALRQFLQEGIACIAGMEPAARALKNAADYHRQRAWLYG